MQFVLDSPIQVNKFTVYTALSFLFFRRCILLSGSGLESFYWYIFQWIFQCLQHFIDPQIYVVSPGGLWLEYWLFLVGEVLHKGAAGPRLVSTGLTLHHLRCGYPEACACTFTDATWPQIYHFHIGQYNDFFQFTCWTIMVHDNIIAVEQQIFLDL